MTKDHCNEVNRKRREAYHQRKAESMLPEVSKVTTRRLLNCDTCNALTYNNI